jgi:uncharacterized membrane protein (GlpM family)
LTTLLLLHLVLAFAIGGSWVTLVTILAERTGSTIGGLVGGLPSISAFSFFFIGLNQSAEAATQATVDFPLILSFSGIFVLAFAVFSKKSLLYGMVSSFIIWLALVTLVVLAHFQNFTLSLLGYAAISTATYLLFRTTIKSEVFAGVLSHYTVIQIVLRAILAGSIVALSVLSSQVGGPVFGAIFSAFPAVFTSTLWITSKSRGLAFSRAICMPLMISATITSGPYSLAVRFLYPILGIWTGTIAAYCSIVPFVVASFYLTSPRRQWNQGLTKQLSRTAGKPV